MADNYIERKMEELRSGRLAPPRKHATGRIPSDSTASLNGKRVVVTEGAHGVGAIVAKAFVDAGCRVAVFDADSEEGRRMAYSKGVRYCPVMPCDMDSVDKAFRGVLKAWRDVDIVVALSAGLPGDCAGVMATVWEEHKHRFPIPSDYGGRLVAVSPSPFEGGVTLRESGITVNSIVVGGEDLFGNVGICDAVARVSLFLSRVENHFVDGSVIRLESGC